MKFKAFTLVEVLVSLAIMSIISFFTFSVITNIRSRQASNTEMQAIEEARLLFVESIAHQHYYNKRIKLQNYDVQQNIKIMGEANKLGILKVRVVRTRNDELVYELKRYVSFE